LAAENPAPYRAAAPVLDYGSAPITGVRVPIIQDVERWLEAFYKFAIDPGGERSEWLSSIRSGYYGWDDQRDQFRERARVLQFSLEDQMIPRLTGTAPALVPLLRVAAETLSALRASISDADLARHKDAVKACRESYRDCIEHLSNQPDVDAGASTTGAPGRPSSRNIVEAEFRRRIQSGEVLDRIGKEATYLAGWLEKVHHGAHPMTAKTIRNTIREEFNEQRVGPKPR
jgi:hypothetical protein